MASSAGTKTGRGRGTHAHRRSSYQEAANGSCSGTCSVLNLGLHHMYMWLPFQACSSMQIERIPVLDLAVMRVLRGSPDAVVHPGFSLLLACYACLHITLPSWHVPHCCP